MAPILTFTADEIWSYLPGEKANHVLMSEWYNDLSVMTDGSSLTERDFRLLLSLRDHLSVQMEWLRNADKIGSSLQAEVDIYIDEATFKRFKDVQAELHFFFITSEVRLKSLEEKPDDACEAVHEVGLLDQSGQTWIKVVQANYSKCVRCWHYVASVGQNPHDPELCSRCIENVNGNGEVRRFF
jgi:isoleucyl-tRNA synthetase